MEQISFEVLGTLRVRDASGADVTPRGALQRRLLGMLVLHRRQVVSVDTLAEVLWPDRPASAASLQSHVFRLRQHVTGFDIEHRPPGYVLDIPDEAVDAHRFERVVSGAGATLVDDPAAALACLDEALASWRGVPFADLDDTDAGRIEADRLAELRCRGIEDRFDALIRLGRQTEAMADLEAFVAREPLRERLRELLMEALAGTGRRADALRVYDAYRRLLAEELGVEPSVHLRSAHERLLAESDRPAAAPSTWASVPAPHLPRPVSSFVGRDELLETLEDRVPQHRMVTLVGPGGVGKTRLVVELMHRLAGGFADGVRFCDLTGVRDDSEVAPTVAAAVGVEPRAGVDPVERLADVLRRERMLLVLDNCEHVLDGAAILVEGLLSSVERLVVVATSRERLAVDGEHVFPVTTLDCGGGAGPATALFVDRAVAALATFTVDDGNRREIEELCQRLDGLPLAIELAAARLNALSLAEICAELEAGTSVLRGGRRTTPRHRSLTAALEWSYRSLDDEDQAVLAAAAQFAGPFGIDDLAAVAGRAMSHVVDRLSDLVERSLVQRVDAGHRLLQVVAWFVAEQTESTEARTTLARRHAERMTERAEVAGAELRTCHDHVPMERIRALVPDLRRAMATALTRGDADLAIRIVMAGNPAALNGMVPEFNAWGISAGELGEATGHPRTAEVLAIAARGAWKAGDLDAMRRLLVRAGDAHDANGQQPGYEYLGTLGVEALARGELRRGVGIWRRALAAEDAVGDLYRQAEGGATLVITAAYAHLPEALEDAEWLLRDIAPETGAVAGSWCWYAAGECLLEIDPAEARVRLERSVELARASGATFVQGVAGASLASLHVRAGDLATAIEHYRWLLPLWLRAGVRSPMRTMLRTVTELLCRQGLDDHAARLLGAVTAPDAGHEVVGDDVIRLTSVRGELERRLGVARCSELVDEGRALDDAGAAAEATTAFELV